jgi:hypothetical protein
MSYGYQRFHDSTNSATLYRGRGLEHSDGQTPSAAPTTPCSTVRWNESHWRGASG